MGTPCGGRGLCLRRVVRDLPGLLPTRAGNQVSLILFLAAVLPLTLLCYRSGLRLRRHAASQPQRDNPTPIDWLLAVVALAACLYPVLPFEFADGGEGFDEFLSRQGMPAAVDVIVGTIVVLLVLEACRRTTGAALPVVCLLALGYAYYGGYLPQSAVIAHAGVDWDQIVSASFIQSTGLYGVPLDVAATYIVLFTIYGAVLDASGASKFFIDLSFAAFRRSRAAPGRTVTLAGFSLAVFRGRARRPRSASGRCAGRYCDKPATRGRTRAECWRPRASARSCPRRHWAPRPSSSPNISACLI